MAGVGLLRVHLSFVMAVFSKFRFAVDGASAAAPKIWLRSESTGDKTSVMDSNYPSQDVEQWNKMQFLGVTANASASKRAFMKRLRAPTRESAAHIRKLWAVESKLDQLPVDVHPNINLNLHIQGEVVGGHGKEETYREYLKRWNQTRPVKFVLGVMTVTSQSELRQAHRETWMQSKGVCTIDRYAEENCHIFPLFVYGNISSNALVGNDAMDSFLLTEVLEPWITEGRTGYEEDGGDHGKSKNMWEASQKKTPSWFKHAWSQFPWATHIGKMDMDAYPRIRLVHYDLAHAPQEGLYYGRRIHWGEPECETGAMYGDFYLVSYDVLTKFNPYLKVDDKGWMGMPEDQYFGTRLMDAQRDKHLNLSLSCFDINTAQRVDHPI